MEADEDAATRRRPKGEVTRGTHQNARDGEEAPVRLDVREVLWPRRVSSHSNVWGKVFAPLPNTGGAERDFIFRSK